VPDAVLGEPVVHTYLRGADPTRRWLADDLLDTDPSVDSLASRLGHLDLSGVSAEDRWLVEHFIERYYAGDRDVDIDLSLALDDLGLTPASWIEARIERGMADPRVAR